MSNTNSENIATKWLSAGEEIIALFAAGDILKACTLLETRAADIDSVIEQKNGITFVLTEVNESLVSALHDQTESIAQLLKENHASHKLKVKQVDRLNQAKNAYQIRDKRRILNPKLRG